MGRDRIEFEGPALRRAGTGWRPHGPNRRRSRLARTLVDRSEPLSTHVLEEAAELLLAAFSPELSGCGRGRRGGVKGMVVLGLAASTRSRAVILMPRRGVLLLRPPPLRPRGRARGVRTVISTLPGFVAVVGRCGLPAGELGRGWRAWERARSSAGWVSDVAVTTPNEGQGSAMVAAVASIADACGSDLALLTAGPRSEHFFRRFGFRPTTVFSDGRSLMVRKPSDERTVGGDGVLVHQRAVGSEGPGRGDGASADSDNAIRRLPATSTATS